MQSFFMKNNLHSKCPWRREYRHIIHREGWNPPRMPTLPQVEDAHLPHLPSGFAYFGFCRMVLLLSPVLVSFFHFLRLQSVLPNRDEGFCCHILPSRMALYAHPIQEILLNRLLPLRDTLPSAGLCCMRQTYTHSQTWKAT